MWICIVSPLNGFGSINLILICGHFLLDNGACMGVVAGVIIIYTGIKKNSVDGLTCCSALPLLFFFKLYKVKKYKKI